MKCKIHKLQLVCLKCEGAENGRKAAGIPKTLTDEQRLAKQISAAYARSRRKYIDIIDAPLSAEILISQMMKHGRCI